MVKVFKRVIWGGRMALGCVEFAVPGSTLEEKLRVLEPRGMWLELVNEGLTDHRLKEILGTLPSFNVQVRSVQANLLRNMQPLSASEKNREIAMRHVEETIELANRIGAQNVVTVATYGKPTVENPVERCADVFRHLGKLAAELNVTVSIEALGKKRTNFLPSVSEVCNLVRMVGSDRVRPMADTMHIYDNGEDVVEVLEEHAPKLMELQLRDTDSKPPGKGAIDFISLLKVACERFEGLMCLEYRPGPNPYADFVGACDFVDKLIAEVR